jgi:parallel beta-helix repeat protein
MKRLLAIGIILLFFGTFIVPNVNCIILKENTQLYPYIGNHDYYLYQTDIYSKISKSFCPKISEHYTYETVYNSKNSIIIPNNLKVVKKSFKPLSTGNTLYVGGSGPANYTRIQDAVDNSSDGDTVFVYNDSSPYKEWVIVNKSINLIGEDKNSTVIYGSDWGPPISIVADYVNISKFTLTCGTVGIFIVSNYNTINENNIVDNGQGDGIFLISCSGNTISNNNISYNGIYIPGGYGMYIIDSFDNNIKGNIISFNGGGIGAIYSNNNSFTGNNILSNEYWGGGMYLYQSDNTIVMDNSFFKDGLILYDSYKNTVQNNTVNKKPLLYLENKSDETINDAGQIFLVNCNNISVENLTINETMIGITLCKTGNSTLRNNEFSNNFGYGIWLQFSKSNTISTNNISYNERGVVLDESIWNTITSNKIYTNSYTGISLIYSSNRNTIIGNNFESNFEEGIYLRDSKNNDISKNIVDGIGLEEYSSYNNIRENTIYGMFLDYYSNSNNINTNTIYRIVIELSSYNIIDMNTIYEMELDHSNNNSITNNNISSEGKNGLLLYYSRDNFITSNKISNNSLGVYIVMSNCNTISGNKIINNSENGMYITYSNYNIITNNNISNSGVLGILIYKSYNNNIIDNVITLNNEEGIFLIDSYFNSIINNKIFKNEDGIELENSHNNIISDNTIRLNNDHGIEFYLHCTNNTIRSNTIESNKKGLYFDNSNNNTIFQNNLLKNNRNALFKNCKNVWRRNYWNGPRILPKIIFGRIGKYSLIPWFNIDRRPALKPYDI